VEDIVVTLLEELVSGVEEFNVSVCELLVAVEISTASEDWVLLLKLFGLAMLVVEAGWMEITLVVAMGVLNVGAGGRTSMVVSTADAGVQMTPNPEAPGAREVSAPASTVKQEYAGAGQSSVVAASGRGVT
jgi:hypothetical protein